MKKGIVAVVVLLIFVLLGIYFYKADRVKVIHGGSLEENFSDSSVVAAWDENGNLIFSRMDSASEAVKLVNSDLNGDVFYRILEDENGKQEKVEVFKYEYRQEDFSIGFNNDTASVTLPFEATFYIQSTDLESISVEIKNAGEYLFRKEYGKHVTKYIYTDKLQRLGMATFEGKVIFNGEESPVRFNYYVK